MKRLILAALALLALPATTPAATPMDARAFVDSQGVNTHLHYNGTPYWDLAKVKESLAYLGIRHVRDGFGSPGRTDMYPRYGDMAAAGIKGTMIGCQFVAGPTDEDDWQQFVADAKNEQVRPFIEALEGVNEPNLFDGGNHDGGEWWNDARGCNYWLYQLTKGTHKTEYGAPLDVPIYGPSPTGDNYKLLGDLRPGPHADGGTTHPYPGNQKPSGPDYFPFTAQMAGVRQYNFGGDPVPVMMGETGYHNAVNTSSGHRPVSEKAAGIYIPRLLLEYARAGVERTFLYELVDLEADLEKDDDWRNFGLFRNDWSAKPSATAIKNMNALLDGPPSPRTPLDIKITGGADPDGSGTRGDVRTHLMQKADGSWWLAAWQNSSVWENGADVTNERVAATVSLPRSMRVDCFYVAGGTCGSIASSTGFTLKVPDGAVLLRFEG